MLPYVFGGVIWHFRFFAKTATDWAFTKPGYMPVSELRIPMGGLSTSRLAFLRFPRDNRVWLNSLRNTRVSMSV